jgi:hypothetical protein
MRRQAYNVLRIIAPRSGYAHAGGALDRARFAVASPDPRSRAPFAVKCNLNPQRPQGRLPVSAELCVDRVDGAVRQLNSCRVRRPAGLAGYRYGNSALSLVVCDLKAPPICNGVIHMPRHLKVFPARMPDLV